jgi:hypothetical protein
MEVTKFEQDTSLKLLYKSSNVIPWADSAQAQAVAKIVEVLDYLPLAICQAAAYIRQVAMEFSAFLTAYDEYRRDLSNWTSQGIRQYPHTVATTWNMSFISANDPTAVELLHLLSFLNPDGILIQFLQSRADCIQHNLRQIISHRIKLQKAFCELERFSLVKRMVYIDGE